MRRSLTASFPASRAQDLEGTVVIHIPAAKVEVEVKVEVGTVGVGVGVGEDVAVATSAIECLLFLLD